MNSELNLIDLSSNQVSIYIVSQLASQCLIHKGNHLKALIQSQASSQLTLVLIGTHTNIAGSFWRQPNRNFCTSSIDHGVVLQVVIYSSSPVGKTNIIATTVIFRYCFKGEMVALCRMSHVAILSDQSVVCVFTSPFGITSARLKPQRRRYQFFSMRYQVCLNCTVI